MSTNFVYETICADTDSDLEQAWEKRDIWVDHARQLERQLENVQKTLAREQDNARNLTQQLHDAKNEVTRLAETRHQLSRQLESSATSIKSFSLQIARSRETNYRLSWLVRQLSAELSPERIERLTQEAESACRIHLKPVLDKYGLAYDGEVQDGMRHGYGSYADADFEYTGMWAEDLPHGEGSRRMADGTVERGEFEQGILAKGVRLLPDGVQEDGTFSDGKLMSGRRQWPDGTSEQGSFRLGILAKGRREGLNSRYEEGSFEEGSLVEGARQNDDCLEQGEFSMGMLHGEGKRSTLQGHLLCEGRFVRGLLHGKGVLQIWEWDCPVLRITGNFTNGKANGEDVKVEYFDRETRQVDLVMTGTIIENVPRQVRLSTTSGTQFSGELAASGYHSLIREQPMSLHINRFTPARGRGSSLHGEFEVRNGILVFPLSHGRSKTAALRHDYPSRNSLWFAIDQVKLNFPNGVSLELKNEELEQGILPREFCVCVNGHRYGRIKPPSGFSSERKIEGIAGLLSPGMRRKLLPQRLKVARNLEKHDEVEIQGQRWYLLRGETPAGQTFVLRLRKDLTECDLQ